MIWHSTLSCRFVFFFTFVFLKVLTLSVFSCLCVIPTAKSQRLCLLWRKIFWKRKLSYTDPLRLGRNFIARAKRALPSGQYRSRGWSYKKHIQINIFNNYSSSPNELWINGLGYWLRGYEGEGNNCFSKIQLVKKNIETKYLSQVKARLQSIFTVKTSQIWRALFATSGL